MPPAVGIQQQRRHHDGIKRRLAELAAIRAGDLAKIDFVPHNAQHKASEMALGNEIRHCHRQQQRLFDLPRAKCLAHAQGQNLQFALPWPAKSACYSDRLLGEHLVAEFAADVAAGTLPQVSWIVAPKIASEHPEAPPAIGQALVAQLLAALTANPEVWARTVFILNYDENDGFFDHVPPPVPAITPTMGKSTVSVAGEIYKDEPVGLGPRVPLLIISPWSKGGFVNSEVFDHTSVIRFLEARFGVMEPNITAWRRAVCGDLLSAFDFAALRDEDTAWRTALPDTADYAASALAERTLPPAMAQAAALPIQEEGQRPARPLPYALEVIGRPFGGFFELAIFNRGTAGACLAVYGDDDGPWFYTCGAGRTLNGILLVGASPYSFRIHGPNGFFRIFEDKPPYSGIAIGSRYDDTTEELVLTLRNRSTAEAIIQTRPLAYSHVPARLCSLAPGERQEDRWAIAESDHWYHVELRSGSAVWQLAGHIETGRISRSDPAIG